MSALKVLHDDELPSFSVSICRLILQQLAGQKSRLCRTNRLYLTKLVCTQRSQWRHIAPQTPGGSSGRRRWKLLDPFPSKTKVPLGPYQDLLIAAKNVVSLSQIRSGFHAHRGPLLISYTTHSINHEPRRTVQLKMDIPHFQAALSFTADYLWSLECQRGRPRTSAE